MKILFISSSIGNKTFPPIGLCYLQAALDKAEYKESKIIDGLPIDKIVEIIKSYDPDVIGISCLTMYRGNSFKVAEMAKKLKPSVKIIFGGPHSTFMWEQILKNFNFVDIVILGEGEITTVELIKALDKNLPLKDVKGIAFKENGEIVKTEPRQFIQNLDDLAFPSYRDINFDDYAVPNPPISYKKERVGGIISSRGCIGNCQFCSTVRFWSRWRSRTAKNVVDEIEFLNKNYNIRIFVFLDDIFTVNQNRVIDICKEIIDRKLDIKWSAETRVDCVSKELFDWMKKAGCFMISFGIETGSPSLMKSLHKRTMPEQVIDAFKMIKEVGISSMAFIMIGNPGETKETIEETKKLLDMIKPDSLGVSIAGIFPCTELCDIAKSMGLITDDFWLTDKLPPRYTSEHNLKDLDWMRLDVVKHYYNSKETLGFYKYVFQQIKSKPSAVLENVRVLLFGANTIAR